MVDWPTNISINSTCAILILRIFDMAEIKFVVTETSFVGSRDHSIFFDILNILEYQKFEKTNEVKDCFIQIFIRKKWGFPFRN